MRGGAVCLTGAATLCPRPAAAVPHKAPSCDPGRPSSGRVHLPFAVVEPERAGHFSGLRIAGLVGRPAATVHREMMFLQIGGRYRLPDHVVAQVGFVRLYDRAYAAERFEKLDAEWADPKRKIPPPASAEPHGPQHPGYADHGIAADHVRCSGSPAASQERIFLSLLKKPK